MGPDGAAQWEVQVAAADESTTTGAEGDFQFTDLRAGETQLVLRSTTSSAAQNIKVIADRSVEVLVVWPGSGRASFSVEMPEGYGIQPIATSTVAAGEVFGTVTDVRDNKPIAGAQIYVRGQNAQATVNSLGQFRLKLSAGTIGLVVVHPQYSTLRYPDPTLDRKSVV